MCHTPAIPESQNRHQPHRDRLMFCIAGTRNVKNDGKKEEKSYKVEAERNAIRDIRTNNGGTGRKKSNSCVRCTTCQHVHLKRLSDIYCVLRAASIRFHLAKERETKQYFYVMISVTVNERKTFATVARNMAPAIDCRKHL